MTSRFAAGSVWKRTIDFDDGEGPRTKFFVLLTDCPDHDGQAIIAMTTSRGRRYHGQTESPCGVPTNPCFRIDEGEEKCFPIATYIQFDQVAAIRRSKLVEIEKSGEGAFVQSLDDQRFRSLLKCAKRSEVIPRGALYMIEAKLKSLTNEAKRSSVTGSPGALTATPIVGVAAVRMKYERSCASCRIEFASIMLDSADALSDVLEGRRPAPTSFVASSDEGFAMARELAGPRCKCPGLHSR